MPKFDIIVTTTPNIEGYRIVDYFGLVTGEAAISASEFKVLMAGLSSGTGRFAQYEKAMEEARTAAMEIMLESASAHGANAIIGTDLDYHEVGSVMMVCVSGTAVKILPAAS